MEAKCFFSNLNEALRVIKTFIFVNKSIYFNVSGVAYTHFQELLGYFTFVMFQKTFTQNKLIQLINFFTLLNEINKTHQIGFSAIFLGYYNIFYLLSSKQI